MQLPSIDEEGVVVAHVNPPCSFGPGDSLGPILWPFDADGNPLPVVLEPWMVTLT